MTWLRSLEVRAEVCAGCHVGAPADAARGLPERDVTHDLVAAGHPRLMFEFRSFLARMPQHWTEKDTRPGFAVRAWAVGGVVSARAALSLLGAHAANPTNPWPELADHDCYGCHHDLTVPSWRQTRSAGPSPPGALRLGRWYPAPVLLVGAGDPLVAQAFQHTIAGGQSDRSRIVREVQAALAALAPRAGVLELETPAQGSIEALRTRLTRHLREAPAADWDEVEQSVLALFAVHQAYQDTLRASGKSPTAADRLADDALRELVRKLAFPLGCQSPRTSRRPGFDEEFGTLLQRISR
jgi:hypothetical protein